MDNLKTYNEVRKPPAEALKDFDNGTFKGTDINSMWRIKKLTEIYGPCGIGWYYTIDKQWMETAEDNVMVFANISLYIKDGEWSKPIAGTGGNKFAYKTSKGYLKVSDEAFKMAVTDALGNATKSLGFGADIYWETDKTKYTQGQYDNTVDNTEKIREAEAELMDFAATLGMNPQQVIDAFEKKYDIRYYNATPDELRKALKDMKKKAEEKK